MSPCLLQTVEFGEVDLEFGRCAMFADSCTIIIEKCSKEQVFRFSPSPP